MSQTNWNKWLRAHIKEVLKEIGVKENQTVLDFGCGSGAYAIPAAELVGKDGKVYALDKNEEALKELNQKRRENIEVLLSADLKTSLKDESVDVILLYDVVHMIEDRARLFAEIHRILKSDGLVSIYPMHVETDELLRQMRKSHFSLAAEKYEGNILNFVKRKT